jgi:hypothetical protein
MGVADGHHLAWSNHDPCVQCRGVEPSDAVGCRPGLGPLADAGIEDWITRDNVAARIGITIACRLGDERQISVRFLDADDVRVGSTDGFDHGRKADLNPSVPDVEGHHLQLNGRIRLCQGRECPVIGC